jgi:hypothetical protein
MLGFGAISQAPISALPVAAGGGTITVNLGQATETNSALPVAKAKAKTSKPRPPSAKVTIERLEIRINEAMREIMHWNKVAKDMTEKAYLADKLNTQLEDALAIIRYLENKLYVALQMVAKNGSNS